MVIKCFESVIPIFFSFIFLACYKNNICLLISVTTWNTPQLGTNQRTKCLIHVFLEVSTKQGENEDSQS